MALTAPWMFFAKAWEQLLGFLLSVVCSCGPVVQILKASKLYCEYNGSVKEPYGESADTKT